MKKKMNNVQEAYYKINFRTIEIIADREKWENLVKSRGGKWVSKTFSWNFDIHRKDEIIKLVEDINKGVYKPEKCSLPGEYYVLLEKRKKEKEMIDSVNKEFESLNVSKSVAETTKPEVESKTRLNYHRSGSGEEDETKNTREESSSSEEVETSSEEEVETSSEEEVETTSEEEVETSSEEEEVKPKSKHVPKLKSKGKSLKVSDSESETESETESDRSSSSDDFPKAKKPKRKEHKKHKKYSPSSSEESEEETPSPKKVKTQKHRHRK